LILQVIFYLFCHFLKLNDLLCAAMPLTNYSLTCVSIALLICVETAQHIYRCSTYFFCIEVSPHYSAPASASLAEGSRADCI